MGNSSLMISYLFVSLCSLLGTCLTHSIQVNKAGSVLISINFVIVLPIAEYEIGISYVILGATIFCDISCKPESD
nr:hypothetical protein Iba_scaffold17693CG0010 [Ipomoea batatas]GME18878.1 hypothetical protein Iba_scaffold21539CG0190 [Ipomoea batatas]